MSDYKITKPQQIRFNVCGGLTNIEEVHTLLVEFAKTKGYEINFSKQKQRGQTPLVDLSLTMIEDRPS